jgi:23S rRNA pseudouridine955/2504/2580 synthase/23S rRNA pseudouridine1911/1915/1917 synthase
VDCGLDPNMKNKPEVVFENEFFLAVNKPSGLLTIPDRHDDTLISLYKILSLEYQKIFIVHRLDKDTSGLILFAKDEVTHKYLSQLFENKKIEKYYLGIIQGSIADKAGTINENIEEHPARKGIMVISKKGKPSVTDYEVVEDYGLYSLIKFHIHSGRTHQIRVHMKHIGKPLACDELYGNGKPVLLSSFKKKYKLSRNEDEEKPLHSRLALHSYKLVFKDQQGNDMELTAEMPKDMRAFVRQLEKRGGG